MYPETNKAIIQTLDIYFTVADIADNKRANKTFNYNTYLEPLSSFIKEGLSFQDFSKIGKGFRILS